MVKLKVKVKGNSGKPRIKAKDPLAEGIKKTRRKPYEWTNGKRICLIRLIKEDPTRSNKQLAELMNEKFPEGVGANPSTVYNEWKKLESRYPEIERKPRRERHEQINDKRYVWTPERTELLLKMFREDPGVSARKVAKVLNDNYPGGRKADEVTVRNKWALIEKDHPKIKRKARQTNTFTPSKEQEGILEMLEQRIRTSPEKYVSVGTIEDEYDVFEIFVTVNKRNGKRKLAEEHDKLLKIAVKMIYSNDFKYAIRCVETYLEKLKRNVDLTEVEQTVLGILRNILNIQYNEDLALIMEKQEIAKIVSENPLEESIFVLTIEKPREIEIAQGENPKEIYQPAPKLKREK